MDSEVHVNHVLYKKQLPGARPVYRQIAVVEQGGRFEVRVFGGEVVQMDPKFIAESSDAEVHMHLTFTEAMADADSEFRRSVSSRKWEPYDPSFPPKYP